MERPDRKVHYVACRHELGADGSLSETGSGTNETKIN